MIYIDANYWIYWFDERLPEHKYVTKPMRDAVNEGIILNTLTLIEVAHYFRRLPRKEFFEKVDTIQNLATLRIISLDENLVLLAFEQLARYAKIGLGGRDSAIIATMKIAGVKRIASHDEVFKKIKELEVVDPIPAS